MDFLTKKEMETYQIFFAEIEDTQTELINFLDEGNKVDKEKIEDFIYIQQNFIFRLKNELEEIFENYDNDEYTHIEWEFDDFEKSIENFWEDYEDLEKEEN